MEWFEAAVETLSDGVELVTAALMEAGITGLQVEDDFAMRMFLETNTEQWDYADEALLSAEKGAAAVKFYVTADAHGLELLSAARAALLALAACEPAESVGSLALSSNAVNDEDWLDNWKKYYKPFKIGERIVVRPIWEEYEAENGELVFTINPGHVFGTGLHQSTRLCIAALEKLVRPGDALLDVGCGSGILSILSLMLGAESAVAADIEPGAADIAYENAAMNGVGKDRYTVLTGNLLTDDTLHRQIAARTYDVVVANIVADVIIMLSPLAPDMLKPGGLFISSGIIRERVPDVLAALAANGFTMLDKHVSDEWVCIVARKG